MVNAGIEADSIIRFDSCLTYRHIRYSDLMHNLHSNHGVLPDAIIESDGQPFTYLVQKNRLGDDHSHTEQNLKDLIRTLACRSDARYLCVVTPGKLDVYPLGIFTDIPVAIRSWTDNNIDSGWRTLLSGMITLDQTSKSKACDYWLEFLLFRLLLNAAEGIKLAVPTLSTRQVISLVGRALFFRLLVDRNIVKETDTQDISAGHTSLSDLFSSPEGLKNTCNWLDKTFNGNLLSLDVENYEVFFDSLDPIGLNTVCWHLSNIQYKSIGGQLSLDWGGIRFQHVPIDVLSQVYEDFAHKFIPELAKQTSVHYTPRQIAEVLVDGTFSAIQSCDPHKAKVLDPAVGCGVFLVIAFRRLVIETWKATGARPDRTKIRQILNQQLVGMDINADALNITALSLYLAALELDPSPNPLDDLKFNKLIGRTLICVDEKSLRCDEKETPLGSLSTSILDSFKGKFDIIVGNPPWSAFPEPMASELNRRLQSLLTDSEPSKEIVARYGAPDIAFLLASRIWGTEKAAIGFVLHGRILFQPKAFLLRKKIFELIRVTGVMNFAALRQDKLLWPSNAAHFFLLVGRNEKPKINDSFYYLSPRHEYALENWGQFRIDPQAAYPLSNKVASTNSITFKAVFKGGQLGFELINRINQAGYPTVSEHLRKHDLEFKSGYQVGVKNKQTKCAEYLLGLPMATPNMSFRVDQNAEQFKFKKIQWPRTPEIYKAPLLLFKESPKEKQRLRGALFAEDDTAFSESFFGLSFHNKPECDLLRDLLYVISYSDLFIYYQLLTSSKFGVERDSALQTDLENFPLFDYQLLSIHQANTLSDISNCLKKGYECWSDVNNIIAEIYGLTESDQQLIRDTLSIELPFSQSKKRASEFVTNAELQLFVNEFNDIINPFLPEALQNLAEISSNKQYGAWRFINIRSSSLDQNESEPQYNINDMSLFKIIAGTYWSSLMKVKTNDGSIIFGRLNHYRYWTLSEARIAALNWLQSEFTSLKDGEFCEL